MVDLPADALPLGIERGVQYRIIKVPLMPGDAFLSLARVSNGAMAGAKSVVAEMVASDAREVVKAITASLPTNDPITGDVFENTVLLLKCVDQPAASDGRSAGNGAIEVLDGGPALRA